MARPNIHGAKVMFCIWWDQLGMVYYEPLKPSETITEDRCRTQLMRLSREMATVPRDTAKLSFSMTMLGHMSQDRSRHTWKR